MKILTKGGSSKNSEAKTPQLGGNQSSEGSIKKSQTENKKEDWGFILINLVKFYGLWNDV